MYSLRHGQLYTGGWYHIFNRGVDKRKIFESQNDFNKFKALLQYTNTEKPIKSIRNIFQGDMDNKYDTAHPLVEIHAYALMSNHYHLLVKQVSEDGVSEFMKRLSGGYTTSFNYHHDRTGSLFGGKYKFIECKNDDQIMRTCAYINLNDKVHNFNSGRTAVKMETSHQFYIGEQASNIVITQECLDLFGSVLQYKKTSSLLLRDILKTREMERHK